jgi:predicted RNA-binding protein
MSQLSKNQVIKLLRRLSQRQWTVIAIVAAVMAGITMIGGRLLSPYAISQIESYTGTKVSVESAKFGLSGSIRLKGLSVVTGDESHSLVLQAKKVSGRFRLLSLLRGKPQLSTLTITGGLLNAEYDTEKQVWNLASLVRTNEDSSRVVGSLPLIQIRDATVKFTRREGGQSSSMLTGDTSSI